MPDERKPRLESRAFWLAVLGVVLTFKGTYNRCGAKFVNVRIVGNKSQHEDTQPVLTGFCPP